MIAHTFEMEPMSTETNRQLNSDPALEIMHWTRESLSTLAESARPDLHFAKSEFSCAQLIALYKWMVLYVHGGIVISPVVDVLKAPSTLTIDDNGLYLVKIPGLLPMMPHNQSMAVIRAPKEHPMLKALIDHGLTKPWAVTTDTKSSVSAGDLVVRRISGSFSTLAFLEAEVSRVYCAKHTEGAILGVNLCSTKQVFKHPGWSGPLRYLAEPECHLRMATKIDDRDFGASMLALIFACVLVLFVLSKTVG